MYILFVIIIFIFFVNFNIIYEPFKPTPTLISNKKQTNNQIPIFINPNNDIQANSRSYMQDAHTRSETQDVLDMIPDIIHLTSEDDTTDTIALISHNLK